MIASTSATVMGVLIVLCLYLLPSLVAIERRVPNVGSVIVINLFLGWTVVGWVVALAMAARSVPASRRSAG